ncbi:MAG: portal protein, partial [Rhodomicrobium sp.]
AVYYAVACGIGHFRIITDYADDNGFDQEILIKRIQHPLSVFWAPGAVEPDRADAEYCLVSEMIGRKEFQKRFPGAAMADFAAPSDLNAESGLFWANRDAVRVCEYWLKRPHERTIARLAHGETVDITEVEPKELRRLQIIAERKVKVAQGRTLPAERRGNSRRAKPVAGAVYPDFSCDRLRDRARNQGHP